ncbi:MAG TPA: 5-formyltetrahydrofolate cyclo-ligase [Proteiniclasticum sp.]|jgi:5-formyltetrahydrofolate cyclo-ligase|uniref:5-formyltetrahydrofolate cyclo-ligase n=1 Tax=Proteiniclasticum sp. TaxID=2053595 RepID=UPI000E8643C4|nr:5-formyltetrahydrofolate cyclo-ligase [Proteiniclasticum sp.]HBW12539.1 5-formyltetrahydrofolate cyclo-ligase [Proteiniclasticum sp.]
MIVNEEVKLQKKELRRKLMDKQHNLDPMYKESASKEILEVLKKQKDYLLAGTIFIYVGQETEVNTTLIIQDALAKGKRVLVPKTVSLGHMEACEIDSMEDLSPGLHGILEPKDLAYQMDPGKIDIAFVPCVAFTKEGYRLGYGGGFYDRFLPRGRFKRILIAFSEMEEDALPRDVFDEKVHGILTEKGYSNL